MPLIDPATASLQQRVDAAERTIAVLKKKVIELYDGNDAGAVRAQIARMRERQEETRRKRQLMEMRAAELARHNAVLEQQVAERTRALRDILDNVTFGFLIIGADLAVREGFTRSCHDLLDRKVSPGQRLPELLDLDASQSMELELCVDMVFEDLMPEEVSLDHMPSQVVMGARTVQIEGRTLRNDQDEVTAILLTLSDITGLLAAQAEAGHNERLVQILRQRSAFESFVQDTREMLCTAELKLHDQELVRRLVHTVKGNAASFQLDGVAAACHTEENRESIDRAAIARLHIAMQEALAGIAEIIPIAYEGGIRQELRVDSHDLDCLLGFLTDPIQITKARDAVRRLSLRPARDLLGPVEVFTERLGERLGKRVELEAKGLSMPVDPAVMKPVLRTVSHLIRNAVDHGIEQEGYRGDKPDIGSIRLQLEACTEAYRVEVADDGSGINGEALVQRAVDAGLLDEATATGLDPEQRCALVFQSGLSVADVTTEISGRGVGMSAVKEAVEAANGSIEIDSRPGRGTTFRLTIPFAA